jgi:uncharacterized protein (DUF2249 family)
MSGLAHQATPSLDLRGLDPPEPMRRALEAVETLRPGEAVEILTDREPLLLQRELSRRDYPFHSEMTAEGCRTTIRRHDQEETS